MDVKKQILNRVTIVFIMMFILTIGIVVKVVSIQVNEGAFWRNFSDSIHLSKKLILAERGTIYSEDGNILSASLPYYDVYIDFVAPMMTAESGLIFYHSLDSLSQAFSKLFLDKSGPAYKLELLKGYKKKIRYYVFKKGISYKDYKAILAFPFLREAKNKYSSGFVFEFKDRRVYPYGSLANRTIGFLRDNIRWNLGLEKAYDSVLQGERRYALMRSIAGGYFIPVEGHDMTPQNGKDIVTTLNMKIQSIVERALGNMLIKNQAEWGTCIVMEVATGKIKAIANLSRVGDSTYEENVNYALKRHEPGSTMKLLSMLALLEDKYVHIDDPVNLNGGELKYGRGIIMYDSEKHNVSQTSIKNAFAISSNVGISRLVNKYYSSNPQSFVDYFVKLNLNKKTGFDLKDEEMSPLIDEPTSKYWSNITSLPWMSIGYGVEVTPLQTLMLYNAVANNGTMVKPYLVSKILDQGFKYQDINPSILKEHICASETLDELKKLLEAVVDIGTARKLFYNAGYKVAGKTGTSLFYDDKNKYKDSTYQSSFVGYFPADAPIYSCIVVIKNKPHAINYYGVKVAGPVFKDISDALMALNGNLGEHLVAEIQENTDKQNIAQSHFKNNKEFVTMPNLKGKYLSDVVTVAELLGLSVQFDGHGKVFYQSINPGMPITQNDSLKVVLK